MDVSVQSRTSDTDTETVEIHSESGDETGVQLIAKKNTTSVVWKYFGFVPDEDGNVKDRGTPKCKLCFSNVTARWSNTSNLMNHLQVHHPKVYTEVKRAQSLSKEAITTSRPRAKPQATGLQTIDQCVERTKKYTKTSKEHQRLTDAVTNCIARDVLPIHTVDKADFCELVAVLNPRYDLTHKDYFSRIAIPSLYEENEQNCYIKCMKKLFAIQLHAADLWSSCTTQPYICLTVHYIDSKWVLQSHCLQAYYIPEDHTGQQLQDALGISLDEWYLDPKKVSIYYHR